MHWIRPTEVPGRRVEMIEHSPIVRGIYLLLKGILSLHEFFLLLRGLLSLLNNSDVFSA
jgi:hypothetical protein